MLPLFASTALVAFALNVPMGAWREQARRFSWQWFLAIHLPVPVVAAMRIGWDVPAMTIPLLLAVSVAGQVAGSRYCRRMRAVAASGV